MSIMKEKLEGLGEGIDLGKLRERFELSELGNKFDLDRLTELLEARKEKKAQAKAWFIMGLVGVAAIAVVVAILVHRFLTPAYTDDFDDDFDDFEDEEE